MGRVATKANSAGGELAADTVPESGGAMLNHATGGETVAVQVMEFGLAVAT